MNDFLNRADRDSLQLSRRLLHIVSSLILVLLYFYFMEKASLISFLGILASLVFIGEQIRIKYPEYSSFFSAITRFFYRADEALEISSALPYVISCLLVVLVFPKSIAIITILFLGLGDPLSAIVGIKFGRHKISAHRSYEGSIAFFVTAFIICIFVMTKFYESGLKVFLFAFLGASAGTLADFIETRLDDNITIPLISAPLLFIFGSIIFGDPIY